MFVKNLVCAIEVKDVSDKGIIFSGNSNVKRNNNEEEPVTDQIKAANELARLFKRRYLNNESSVYVSAVTYLTALFEKIFHQGHIIFLVAMQNLIEF